MKIINPLNRTPDTEETMVMACRCICSSGSASMKVNGKNHWSMCGCRCKQGNIANKDANGMYAKAN